MGRVTVMAAALALGGCSGDAARPVTTAMLVPSTPGWLAFCARHGGDCARIPAATAMPEGGPAPAPPPWRDFCRRNRTDAAC